MDLVPIKVKIGLRTSGEANHPNFNTLAVVVDSGMDWSNYIDTFGSGWLYDQDSGHKETRDNKDEWDSPHGEQWGMVLVPKLFADQAVAAMPGIVTKLDETKCQHFYDNFHAKNLPDNNVDEKALKEFQAKTSSGAELTVEETARRDKALDPNDSAPGITKNQNKKWVDFKTMKGVNIVQ